MGIKIFTLCAYTSILCLYPTLPYFQSSSCLPSWLMTSHSKVIHHCQWVHIYSNLRPPLFLHKLNSQTHALMGIALPIRMPFSHHCCSRPTLSEAVMQLLSISTLHPYTKLSSHKPILDLLLFLHLVIHILGVSWERAYRGNHDEQYRSLGSLFTHLFVPSDLAHASFWITVSSYVGLLLILTNFMTWWIPEGPTHDG